jgi:hypothetical protein
LDRGGKTGAVGRCGWRHGLGFVAGIHGALVHPPGKISDDGLGELRPILGHPGIGARVSNAFEKKALARVSRDQGRTRFPAVEKPVPKIHPQTALLLLGPMAFVALVGEDGTNTPFKEFDSVGRSRPRRPRQQHPQTQNKPGDPAENKRDAVIHQ